MKTTAAELRRRALALPPDFEKYIVWRDGNAAKVKSFSCGAIYSVHIQPTDDSDGLDAICTCPANLICHHITAFFAMAKGLKSEKEPTVPPATDSLARDPAATSKQGLGLIAEAIEKLVDGITLVIEGRWQAAEMVDKTTQSSDTLKGPQTAAERTEGPKEVPEEATTRKPDRQEQDEAGF